MYRLSSKAVAEGALWFYLDNRVRARIARYTYGSPLCPWYTLSNSKYVLRDHPKYAVDDGALDISTGFAILAREVRLLYAKHSIDAQSIVIGIRAPQSRKPLSLHSHMGVTVATLVSITADVMSYRGNQAHTRWTGEEPSEPLHTVRT